MKRIFGSCTILLLGLAAIQTTASAQATPGLEGAWFGEITPIDCQTRMQIPNALPFHVLNMFGHDGSLTNESANFVATPASLRSSGVGHWQHTQAQTYTATFWFFVYNPNESFMLLREVTLTITLNGNQFTSVNQVQDYDWNNQPLSNVACNIQKATRIQ